MAKSKAKSKAKSTKKAVPKIDKTVLGWDLKVTPIKKILREREADKDKARTKLEKRKRGAVGEAK